MSTKLVVVTGKAGGARIEYAATWVSKDEDNRELALDVTTAAQLIAQGKSVILVDPSGVMFGTAGVEVVSLNS